MAFPGFTETQNAKAVIIKSASLWKICDVFKIAQSQSITAAPDSNIKLNTSQCLNFSERRCSFTHLQSAITVFVSV